MPGAKGNRSAERGLLKRVISVDLHLAARARTKDRIQKKGILPTIFLLLGASAVHHESSFPFRVFLLLSCPSRAAQMTYAVYDAVGGKAVVLVIEI